MHSNLFFLFFLIITVDANAVCRPGHWGQDCRNICGIGCENKQCDPISGYCVCRNGFWGERCVDQCSYGCEGMCDIRNNCYCNGNTWRYACDYACESSCRDMCVEFTNVSRCMCLETDYFMNSQSCLVCYKENGHCAMTCKDGFWGPKCDNKCSIHCNGICNKFNGHCSYCKPGFKGDFCECYNPECNTCDGPHTCTSCVPGRYGSAFCQNHCSRGCVHGICKMDGTCICRRFFQGPNCNICVPDHFGENCEKECPNCLHKLCNDNGICLHGCLNQNVIGNKCESCALGLYGVEDYDNPCNKTCNSDCFGMNCDSKSGVCLGDCIKNVHGPKCEHSCSSSCVPDKFGNLCHTNGSCVGKCLEGYYGEQCQNTCDTNCENTACLQYSGRCRDGCKHGYYSHGSKCTSYGGLIGGLVAAAVVIAVIVVYKLRKTCKHRCVNDGGRPQSRPFTISIDSSGYESSSS